MTYANRSAEHAVVKHSRTTDIDMKSMCACDIEEQRSVEVLVDWAEAARWVTEHVPCDLIDLNMGCPVPRVVTRGAGAALMRDPSLVERLVGAVVNATSLPVTAKTRSGWAEGERNAVDVARAVEAAGGVAIAVHARTRSQRHEGPVDWPLLASVREAVSIPVIGNGGIVNAEGALAMRSATGVDAVMIGRGALGNPWIFRSIERAWRGEPDAPPTLDERIADYLFGVPVHRPFRSSAVAPVVYKLPALLSALESGAERVLYTDVDVVWLQSPLPYFQGFRAGFGAARDPDDLVEPGGWQADYEREGAIDGVSPCCRGAFGVNAGRHTRLEPLASAPLPRCPRRLPTPSVHRPPLRGPPPRPRGATRRGSNAGPSPRPAARICSLPR